MFSRLHDEKEGDLALYPERLKEGQEAYYESYRRIKESREAFDGFTPASSVKNATPRDNVNPGVNKNSIVYPPYLSSTIELRMETMLANSPVVSLQVTKAQDHILQRALNHKLREIYGDSRISLLTQEIYKRAEIDGICVCQAIASDAGEEIMNDDGQIEYFDEHKRIDLVIYDSLGVMVDPNAHGHDIRKTARWAITTLGYFTPDYLNQKYGIELHAGSGTMHHATNDAYAIADQVRQGKTQTTHIPVREYYLRGKYYLIVGDDYIIHSDTGRKHRIPNNGSVKELPLIFVTLNPGLSNTVFGTPLHHKIQPLVEPLASLMNKVLDATYKNLSAPILSVLPNLENISIPFDTNNKIVNLGGLGDDVDLRKVFYQPSFSYEPQAVMSLMQEFKGLLQMVTRTNDLSFGMQDKQVRNEAVANLLGQSMLRNASYLVVMYEHSFCSAFARDILRLMYKYYDELGGLSFDDEEQVYEIKRDQLKHIKSILVENGSMLESAKASRLEKAGLMLELLNHPQLGPIIKSKESLREFMEAVGIAGYGDKIKTEEQLLAEMQTQLDLPQTLEEA